MKYLLLILLAACQTVTAQTDTTDFVVYSSSSRTGIGTNDEHASILFYTDSTLEIRGDSLSVIKLLWKRWQESGERESKAWVEYEKLYKVYQATMDGLEKIHAMLNKPQVAIQEVQNTVTPAVAIEKPKTEVFKKGNTALVRWVIGGAIVFAIIVILIALRPVRAKVN